MNDSMMDTQKQFALDVPRNIFEWNEASQSFDTILEQGVKVCVIGITDELTKEVRPGLNAIRLWCDRYGNTIVGRIAQIMHKDDEIMTATLAGVRFVQVKAYFPKKKQEPEIVLEPEFVELENRVIDSDLAEKLKAGLAIEPDIDLITLNILDGMNDEIEALA